MEWNDLAIDYMCLRTLSVDSVIFCLFVPLSAEMFDLVQIQNYYWILLIQRVLSAVMLF